MTKSDIIGAIIVVALSVVFATFVPPHIVLIIGMVAVILMAGVLL